MTAIDETLPVAELAAVVSEALASAGLDAVLSGGSVVTIYSDNEYQSFDLDFVTTERMNRLEDVMASIGYQRASGRHFEHPSSRYLVEFPSGPLSVGDEVLRDTGRVTTPVGTIRLLTPTQCVMDRLASYYHWSDPQGLEQALMVAKRHEVILDDLKNWSIREGHAAGFDRFKQRLDASRRP